MVGFGLTSDALCRIGATFMESERSMRKHWWFCETRLSDALPLQELGQYRVQQHELQRNLIVGISAA